MIDFVKPEGCTHCTPYRDATRELVVPLCRCREAAPQPAAPIKPGLTPAADQPAAQAVAPDVDYIELMRAAWERHKYRQGTGLCIAFKHGAEWQASRAAAAPVAQPLTPLTEDQAATIFKSWRSGPLWLHMARGVEAHFGIGASKGTTNG